jgi:hypothetical protein
MNDPPYIHYDHIDMALNVQYNEQNEEFVHISIHKREGYHKYSNDYMRYALAACKGKLWKISWDDTAVEAAWILTNILYEAQGVVV